MEKVLKIIILIPTPDFPQFHILLGANLGSHLYWDVSVMDFLKQYACTIFTTVSEHKMFLANSYLDNMTAIYHSLAKYSYKNINRLSLHSSINEPNLSASK